MQLPGALQAEIGADDGVSLKDELTNARHLLKNAKGVVHRFVDEIRSGNRVDARPLQAIVERLTESVFRNKDALVSVTRVKGASEYADMHALAVSALCISFARHLGLDFAQIQQIGLGGLIHDVGMLNIPDEILHKPGRLTNREFATIKSHVNRGNRLVQKLSHIGQESMLVVLQHHERSDGSGYPDGLREHQISLFAQITAIVDVYDALTAKRAYRSSLPPTVSLRNLLNIGGTHLNRELVERFIAFIGIYPVGSLVRLQSGLVGIVVASGSRGLLYPVIQVFYDARRREYVDPIVIDLSNTAGHSDCIVGCESPEKFNLKGESSTLYER